MSYSGGSGSSFEFSEISKSTSPFSETTVSSLGWSLFISIRSFSILLLFSSGDYCVLDGVLSILVCFRFDFGVKLGVISLICSSGIPNKLNDMRLWSSWLVYFEASNLLAKIVITVDTSWNLPTSPLVSTTPGLDTIPLIC